MLEKQKEGDFLTEILGVFGCEAIVPFWYSLYSRGLHSRMQRITKKTVCATAPAVA
jgi:hypothetical protein